MRIFLKESVLKLDGKYFTTSKYRAERQITAAPLSAESYKKLENLCYTQLFKHKVVNHVCHPLF